MVNKIGKQVLQMCKGLGLYIVNGRIRGDSLGRFTYCSVLGSSVVDYSITDIEPGYINAFVVLPQLPISDHSQTILYLKKSVTHTEKTNIQPNLFPLPRTYKWSEHSNNDYTAALCCDEIQYMVDTFLITQYQPNRKGMNLATRDLNIFIQLAKKSKLKISRSRKTSTKQKEKWFDRECASSKKNLRKLSNKKHRNPNDQVGRLEYFQALKQYKKQLHVKKSQYMESEPTKIEKAVNPNSFWQLWKKINTTPQTETNPIKNGNIWKKYFEDLYKNPESQGLTSNQNLTIEKLKILETTIKDNQCTLDYPITIQELKQKLKAQKKGNACGIDSINSEMLKHSSPKLQLAVLKLFNLVLKTGSFPVMWNKGLITPIFKSGDKLDPSNYRGMLIVTLKKSSVAY